MAYQLSYWKGTPEHSDEVIKPRRLARVIEIENVLRPIPGECDFVALERTDGQGTFNFRIVWTRKKK